MNSVLLIVERPDLTIPERLRVWQNFPRVAESIARQEAGVEILGENCWLIPLGSDLLTFVEIVRAAQERQLSCRALFFQDPPRWVRTNP